MWPRRTPLLWASTSTCRARRGTYGAGPALLLGHGARPGCESRVGDIQRHSVGQRQRWSDGDGAVAGRVRLHPGQSDGTVTANGTWSAGLPALEPVLHATLMASAGGEPAWQGSSLPSAGSRAPACWRRAAHPGCGEWAPRRRSRWTAKSRSSRRRQDERTVSRWLRRPAPNAHDAHRRLHAL